MIYRTLWLATALQQKLMIGICGARCPNLPETSARPPDVSIPLQNCDQRSSAAYARPTFFDDLRLRGAATLLALFAAAVVAAHRGAAGRPMSMSIFLTAQ
jgi:hypothetical protein